MKSSRRNIQIQIHQFFNSPGLGIWFRGIGFLGRILRLICILDPIRNIFHGVPKNISVALSTVLATRENRRFLP